MTYFDITRIPRVVGFHVQTADTYHTGSWNININVDMCSCIASDLYMDDSFY
jgi:hypothetical protein